MYIMYNIVNVHNTHKINRGVLIDECHFTE